MDGPLARVTRRRLLLSSAAAAAGLLATPRLARQAVADGELDLAWPLLGHSVEGREIEGIGPLGSGPLRVAIVGGIHGGSESVTAKDGPGGVAEDMARMVAEATGYPYVMDWTAYTLTGQLTDWLDALGIRGVEVDLPRSDDPQWERNLAGMRAALGYLAGAAIPMRSQ